MCNLVFWNAWTKYANNVFLFNFHQDSTWRIKYGLASDFLLYKYNIFPEFSNKRNLEFFLKTLQEITGKGMRFCHIFWFSNLLYSQPNVVDISNYEFCLKYQRLTSLGCKDIGMRKFECEARQRLNSSYIVPNHQFSTNFIIFISRNIPYFSVKFSIVHTIFMLSVILKRSCFFN